MRKKKHDKETAQIIQKQIDQPRISKSARIAELNLDVARISEPASTIMPGTVEKLIPSLRPNRPEKAQIGVDWADLGYRSLRIENSLTDEHGDEVKTQERRSRRDYRRGQRPRSELASYFPCALCN
jgi:hypothetical protein